MICANCQRDANDNPVAYYDVGAERPIWKCWLCLTVQEMAVFLDPPLYSNWRLKQNARRGFEMQKTIKEQAV